MKTFSFLTGNKADAAEDIRIEVDRSAAPIDARVGLWIDDDGRAFPQIERMSRASREGFTSGAEFVLLDRARVRTKIGPIEGLLTLEPGTRFDLDVADNKLMNLQGGEVKVLGGRRFVAISETIGKLQLQKRPREVRVMTLQWEPPPGATRGQRFPVHVVQRNARGAITGGLTIEFVVD